MLKTMAESKTAKKVTKTSAKTKAARGQGSGVLSAEELAAMRETIRERKRGKAGEAGGESAVLEAIAAMQPLDRAMAGRIHALIKANAPDLSPKTWYGMPAYARDGKVICFFQAREKFKARYSTLGFNDGAHLDEGAMWPTAFALTKLTGAE